MEFIEQKVSEDELRAHTAQQEVSATELETQRIEAALARGVADAPVAPLPPPRPVRNKITTTWVNRKECNQYVAFSFNR